MWQAKFDELEDTLLAIDVKLNEYTMQCYSEQRNYIKTFIKENIIPNTILYKDCSHGYIITYTFLKFNGDSVSVLEDLGVDTKIEKQMDIKDFYLLLKENQHADS